MQLDSPIPRHIAVRRPAAIPSRAIGRAPFASDLWIIPRPAV